MRYDLIALVALVELGILLLVGQLAAPFGFVLASPAFLLESKSTDFESLADDLSKKGVRAKAPATIAGKSGVRHEFAFAVQRSQEGPKVVVDTELSVKAVEEMKVLKFYVKVFDVSPEKAILCVSPKLSQRAAALAREYRILVLEDEVPRKLVGMAAEAVDEMLAKGDS